MLVFGHSLKTYQRQFGFMPDFNASIAEEIDFARRYFSFIEITLKDAILTKKQIEFLKEKLKGLKVFGHLHWDIDLADQFLALKHFKAHQEIGAKQITIHPQPNIDLKPYVDFCQKYHINLLAENNIHKPFNVPRAFKKLFKQYPSLGMTFDWGHSQFRPRSSKKFFSLFAKKIRHIHLHHNHKRKFDHLPFPAASRQQSWQRCFQFLKQYKIQPTITLEIFYKLVSDQRTPLVDVQRRQILLKQLSRLREK